MTEVEQKPFEDKKIKIGVTLVNEDNQQLLADVEKWELEKEVCTVTYGISVIPLGGQQIGNNVNMQLKVIHSAFVIYWGTHSELKKIKFEQQLKR